MSKEYWKPGNMLYPVPAVMVSCGREGEKPNIITVAWAGTICSDPAMVSISVRKERYSHDIIKETGEFVINLVNKRLVRATDYCGVKSGRDVDKFAQTRLTPQASRYVKAPGIEESPVNIECKVTEVKELGSHDMFLATNFFAAVSRAFAIEFTQPTVGMIQTSLRMPTFPSALRYPSKYTCSDGSTSLPPSGLYS